ncbi:amyloid-beta-like protein isoform X1 [Anabrus simplex]|uniref:amyloid-beta-like protein isoform X1 n=1 Tax=Anabrus simplex TaxID=316456 RepID=UPI0034DCCBE7
MLLPCGISLFSGVEFVCCPKHFKDNLKPKKPIDIAALKGKEQEVFDAVDEAAALDEDEDEDDEDEDESDAEEAADDAGSEDEEDDYVDDYDGSSDVVSSTVAAPASKQQNIPTPSPTAAPASSAPLPSHNTPVPTPDPYFTHFDPRVEHQMYKDAQQRLEEMHREKVTKVMKDWSDLEERYQDMRSSDPKAADDFKKRMTERFQKTVQALEEEGDAEKHQLVAMHQQRVMAHINDRKKEAMGCYTQALNDNPPNTHRVQKCLQKLLRALHKDRHHTISHYRHLLVSSFEQAEREKALTLEHLTDIDKMVNQSLQMLERFPDLSTKIGQLMEDYIQALRSKDETPGSLLAMTRDAEAAILDKYRADVAAKQEEKERQRQLEKQRKEQRKKERVELREEKHREEAKHDKFDGETMEDEHVDSGSNNLISESSSPVPEAAQPHREETAHVAHAQAHDVSHGEATYSVRREVYHRESKSIYFTLAFAGIALMAAVIVGIAVLRRRNARSPQNQGFVEVDQAATPEERHVANMQINGYENPTYKYFEVKE